jgi:hypothetical protein
MSGQHHRKKHEKPVATAAREANTNQGQAQLHVWIASPANTNPTLNRKNALIAMSGQHHRKKHEKPVARTARKAATKTNKAPRPAWTASLASTNLNVNKSIASCVQLAEPPPTLLEKRGATTASKAGTKRKKAWPPASTASLDNSNRNHNNPNALIAPLERTVMSWVGPTASIVQLVNTPMNPANPFALVATRDSTPTLFNPTVAQSAHVVSNNQKKTNKNVPNASLVNTHKNRARHPVRFAHPNLRR